MIPYYLVSNIFLENEQEELLLLHRKRKGKNDIWSAFYDGIGGKIESYESPLEGLQREIQEEIGLKKVSDIKLRLMITAQAKTENWLIFIYTGKIPKEKIKQYIIQEGKLEWVKRDQVQKKKLAPDMALYYPYLFKSKIHYMKILFSQGIHIQLHTIYKQ